MNEEATRIDADAAHIESCQTKLNTLKEQEVDLTTALTELLEEMMNGTKYMKVYKQMKMYNDPALNPVLYAQK